jgi:hypothetical protein
MMTSGVAGGELPSSMAAHTSHNHWAAGRARGQSRRTWLVLAMVWGRLVMRPLESGMRQAGHRQQACCMGVSPVVEMVAPLAYRQ